MGFLQKNLFVVLAMVLTACSAADGVEVGPMDDAASDAPSDVAAWPIDARADAGADAEASGDALADARPCGADMALVTSEAGRVCIDLYEGAIVVASEGDRAWPFYEALDGQDASFRAVPARGIMPQGYISAEQARAACEASGKRLCTFDEWTAACRGRPDHDYVYPYGDTYEPGACNEGKESPIVKLFGPDPTYTSDELNDPRCDQLEGGLARGGDYAECKSAYGAFDMHGNLHEWIDDTPVPEEPSRGSFMGGYFVDAKINGAGCTYRTTAHAKTYHDYSTGFRCCRSMDGTSSR